MSAPGLSLPGAYGHSDFSGNGLRFIPVAHEENQNRSNEEVAVIVNAVNNLADGRHQWVDKFGARSTITLDDIMIVAPYNAQVSDLRASLPVGARIGTVDKFQGQEAPVVIYSMTSSTVSDAPRGMGFLFSRDRMNVATSRARCLVVLVSSPTLFEPDCTSIKGNWASTSVSYPNPPQRSSARTHLLRIKNNWFAGRTIAFAVPITTRHSGRFLNCIERSILTRAVRLH